MKEKESGETQMTGIQDTPACARAEDLVSYLYGEADRDAAHSFEAHMQACASCHAELAGFRQVRSSVGDWRAEALGSQAPVVAANGSTVAAAPARLAAERKRSALAAIREFFSLSPVWMRAATATLAIVFCALVALTVARYVEQPKTLVVVDKATRSQPSAEKSPELANVQQKTETATAKPSPEGVAPEQQIVKVSDENKDRARPKVWREYKQSAAANRELAKTPKLKLSPQESREIARDLRLVASKDEDDLPRLSDLIDETN